MVIPFNPLLYASHPLFFKPRILQNFPLLVLIKTSNEARAVLHIVFQPQRPIQVHRMGLGGWLACGHEGGPRTCLAISKESSLETRKALESITVAPEVPKRGGWGDRERRCSDECSGSCSPPVVNSEERKQRAACEPMCRSLPLREAAKRSLGCFKKSFLA